MADSLERGLEAEGFAVDVANDGELLEAARKLAVAEARAKAETYAAAAGVKLGVIGLSANPPPEMGLTWRDPIDAAKDALAAE